MQKKKLFSLIGLSAHGKSIADDYFQQHFRSTFTKRQEHVLVEGQVYLMLKTLNTTKIKIKVQIC